MIDRVARYLLYFRRGHSGYLAFIIALANFVVIQYRLLVEYIPSLEVVFQSLLTFIIIFIAIYIPLTVIIGWLDYRRFLYPREAAIVTEANPYIYRAIPGKEVILTWPSFLLMLQSLNRLLQKEGLLSDEEKRNFEDVINNLKKIIEGGAVGMPYK